MILKQELMRNIKEHFSLNIYETKVWLALLSKGIASAGEVAELSGVPRSRTYDVLESLEKRGFAIIKIGKPVKYISVKPTEVIEKIKNEMLQEAQDKVKSLSALRKTNEYTELEQLHNSGITIIKPHEITGSLRGRSNVMSKMRDLLETAEHEVLICTSVADFENKSRVLAPALERLSKSNVKVRLALSGDAERIKKLITRLALKPRMIDTPARFFIADRKQVLFMITPEHADEEMGIWLNSGFFTDSLMHIAEQAFKNGNGAQ